jgi:hypothetical protein
MRCALVLIVSIKDKEKLLSLFGYHLISAFHRLNDKDKVANEALLPDELICKP